MTYPNTQLFIAGVWRDASDGKTIAVFNPATGKEIGRVAHAGIADLDLALAAAQKGFESWRDMPAIERARIMRKAAGLMRERAIYAHCIHFDDEDRALMRSTGSAWRPSVWASNWRSRAKASTGGWSGACLGLTQG